MKTVIYYTKIYTVIAILVLIFIYSFGLMEKRDKANANYWEQRQSECRSLGNDWDLNNKGKCVQIEMY